MHLVAGRDLERAGLDLDESAAANQARNALTIRPRANSAGRRSA